jgi:hypothetical protein
MNKDYDEILVTMKKMEWLHILSCVQMNGSRAILEKFYDNLITANEEKFE